MDSLLFVVLFFVNLIITFLNGRAVGLAWVEAMHAGGCAKVMVISGYVMTAAGVTWCLAVIVFPLLVVIPPLFGFPAMPQSMVEFSASLVMLVLFFEVLTSGLFILVDNWAEVYRSKGSSGMGRAFWNSFAYAHNSASAINSMGEIMGSILHGVSEIFGNDDDDNDGAWVGLAILIFLALVCSGFLIAWMIVKHYAGSRELPE